MSVSKELQFNFLKNIRNLIHKHGKFHKYDSRSVFKIAAKDFLSWSPYKANKNVSLEKRVFLGGSGVKNFKNPWIYPKFLMFFSLYRKKESML